MQIEGLERVIATYHDSRITRVDDRRSPVRVSRDRLILLRGLNMALPRALKGKGWLFLHVQHQDEIDREEPSRVPPNSPAPDPAPDELLTPVRNQTPTS